MAEKKRSKKWLGILAIILIAVVAILCIFAFQNKTPSTTVTEKKSEEPKAADKSENAEDKTFDLIVVDQNGQSSTTSLTTDESNLGEFLEEQGIIAGEDSQYGLYVKEVNGIAADYDTNGAYWKLQVNGKDSDVGVDSVEITDGDTYTWIYSAE